MKTYNPLKGKSAAAPTGSPRNTDSTNGKDTRSRSPLQGEPPPPVDTGTPDLEPGKFPIHALNPTMRAMVENVAEVYRVPIQLPAMCAVAIVSGSLGNAFTLTEPASGE